MVRLAVLWGALAATVLGLAGCGAKEPAARFLREVEWVGKGVWLKADTHIHTKFSDGAHTVSEVVAKAAEHGCDVVAITDHADRDLTAATPEYAAAIEAARREHPEMIILAGVEWNIPPWGGDEHATVIVPTGPEEWRVLADFKKRFDDLGREKHDPELAGEALKWLAQAATVDGVLPLVIYEHPSRRRASSLDIVADVQGWRSVNDLVIGLSGAPGHQRANPLGAYEGDQRPIDRWDPAAARVGDAWDRLLGQGLDVWAAYAPSDFHYRNADSHSDPWPGEFSETWLYAAQRTAAGALRAFRSGTFFAAHGHIAREVVFTVDAPDLQRAALPGEVIEVVAGTQVTVRVELVVPQRDWAGEANRIDAVELIAITPESAAVVANQPLESQQREFTATVEVSPGGLVLRARGRRRAAQNEDLMFYTNPIRIRVRNGR